MKKILVDDFGIEKNDWGYYFTAGIDFLGQNSELLLNYDTEDEISEVELKDILNKSLEKINNILEKAEKNKSQLMEEIKKGNHVNHINWIKHLSKSLENEDFESYINRLEQQKENDCCINDDIEYTPITEEDFEKSLKIVEISHTYSDEKIGDISVLIHSDYFCTFCLKYLIKEDGSFSDNGVVF